MTISNNPCYFLAAKPGPDYKDRQATANGVVGFDGVPPSVSGKKTPWVRGSTKSSLIPSRNSIILFQLVSSLSHVVLSSYRAERRFTASSGGGNLYLIIQWHCNVAAFVQRR